LVYFCYIRINSSPGERKPYQKKQQINIEGKIWHCTLVHYWWKVSMCLNGLLMFAINNDTFNWMQVFVGTQTTKLMSCWRFLISLKWYSSNGFLYMLCHIIFLQFSYIKILSTFLFGWILWGQWTTSTHK